MVGVIIIGDEILRAQVRESNSHFIIRELLAIGQQVAEISVIPDKVDTIARTVARFIAEYEYVISTGGVGPTHDDVTMQGVAQALGVPLKLHGEMHAFLRAQHDEELSPSLRKMAMLPEGSSIVKKTESSWPLIRHGNLFLLPGLPQILQAKLAVLRDLLPRLPVQQQALLFLDTREHLIADELIRFQEAYPRVLIGSYPAVEDATWTVKITLTSQETQDLDRLFSQARETFRRYLVDSREPDLLQ